MAIGRSRWERGGWLLLLTTTKAEHYCRNMGTHATVLVLWALTTDFLIHDDQNVVEMRMAPTLHQPDRLASITPDALNRAKLVPLRNGCGSLKVGLHRPFHFFSLFALRAGVGYAQG